MIIVMFTIALVIFLALSRRKFGQFILAISAGFLFNSYWNTPITDFIAGASLNIPEATLSGIVGLILIIVPGILILGKSAKEDSWIFSIIGSVISITFLMCVILPSFTKVFSLDSFSLDIVQFLTTYTNWVILVGVISAILDTLSFNPKKLAKKS